MSEERAGDGSRPVPVRAGAAAPARGGWRAWAELLRAPLLLSPIADVLAGWCVGTAGTRLVVDDMPGGSVFADAAALVAPALACAAAAGVSLLAAGMAQNALADQRDDALRKPSRPLPRGALSRRAVWFAWTALTLAGFGLATLVSAQARTVAIAIIALTAAYHALLKRARLPGCLALGCLRGLDLALGICVAQSWMNRADGAPALPYPVHWSPWIPAATAVLYALLAAGASLHASIDDEAPGRRTTVLSSIGVGLHMAAFVTLAALLCLAALGMATYQDDGTILLGACAALVVLGLAVQRVLRADRTLPPGPLTGVLLSGFYLFDAAACLVHRTTEIAFLSAALVLGLFAVSRRMRRAFPPT